MNIISLLEEKKVSQRELARRLNCNASYVNWIMKEEHSPRFKTVCSIADALDVTTEDIRKEVEKNEKKNKNSSST